MDHLLPLVQPVAVAYTNKNNGLLDLARTVKITRIFVHPSWLNAETGELFMHRKRDVAVFAVQDLEGTADDLPGDDLAFATGRLPDFQTNVLVSYGVDFTNNANSEKKQQANFQSLPEPRLGAEAGLILNPAPPDDQNNETGKAFTASIYAHRIGTTTDPLPNSSALQPQTQHGDSGGPLLVRVPNTNTWRIGGVVHGTFEDTTVSFFERAASIALWAKNPETPPNAAGQAGMFINAKNLLCMGVTSTIENGAVRQHYCKGDLLLTDPQFWKLATAPVAGAFNLKVGNSGKCLSVNAANDLEQLSCVGSAQATHQAFILTTVGGKRRLKNVKTGKCVGSAGGSVASGSRLSVVTCATDDRQLWHFTR